MLLPIAQRTAALIATLAFALCAAALGPTLAASEAVCSVVRTRGESRQPRATCSRGSWSS